MDAPPAGNLTCLVNSTLAFRFWGHHIGTYTGARLCLFTVRSRAGCNISAIDQIPLGSSRHVSTRFEVLSPWILAVSSSSNSTARHARQSTRRARLVRHVRRVEPVELVVSSRDVTSQVEFGLMRKPTARYCEWKYFNVCGQSDDSLTRRDLQTIYR